MADLTLQWRQTHIFLRRYEISFEGKVVATFNFTPSFVKIKATAEWHDAKYLFEQKGWRGNTFQAKIYSTGQIIAEISENKLIDYSTRRQFIWKKLNWLNTKNEWRDEDDKAVVCFSRNFLINGRRGAIIVPSPSLSERERHLLVLAGLMNVCLIMREQSASVS